MASITDNSIKSLEYRDILKLWFPLALMWMVMAMEMPVVNAVIARMDNARENLAIFGVVMSISLVIEGPVIQMLSAATALTGSYSNYKKLSRFLLLSVIILTLVHLFCAFPPVFRFIAYRIMNLNEHLIKPAGVTFLLMLPWTAAIGYRRMWQGVLIRDGRTFSVTIIMVFRIAATFTVVTTGYLTGYLRGSYLAAVSLSSGVTAGAVFAGLFASSTIRKKRNAQEGSRNLTWKYILIFYAPLALTSFITMANRPIISGGIARGLSPIESLALWPVAVSLLYLFQSFPLSFQEAAITLISDNPESNNKLRKTIAVIGAATALCFLSVVIIPGIRYFFFFNITGLPPDLVDMAVNPLLIMAAVPLAAPLISWLRAVNIRKGTTVNVAAAVGVNLFTVFTSVTVLTSFFKLPGVLTAALCYTSAIYAEALFLFIKTGRTKE